MNDAAGSVEAIFDAVLRQRDPAGREAYLASACGGDARLRARVESLLKAHEEAGSFLSGPPAVDSSVAATIDGTPGSEFDSRAFLRSGQGGAGDLAEQPGSIIGHYKLLQRIGEGGFGTVWMADQDQPVRRRVALKIIKAGMDTKQVIARFEQERQALALMDHPSIARVLDAGATETGRPYFVMELVRGVKITDYCDDHQLTTIQRIELFISVCQAIQHAHQKGIIHRDLKPSNILVTVNDAEPVPKVIDFGVAKATQGRLTDGTLFTHFEQMIGTPLYMSPEQAEMTSLDVDTRSDIYSLGVLLYELLTGRTPIDTATMAKAGMDEIRRLIREVDPPRPSTRLRTLAGDELTSVAKRRHSEPAKLSGMLRGDLDWIVMKCLEKDRKRRYDTANGLAMDLQRHLDNEVVMARPPTTAYLLSKLVRRNKAACLAGAAIVASLLIGIALSVWQAVRATQAERNAVATLDELRATAPAFAEQARALAAKEQFGDAIAKLDYAIKLQPAAPEHLVAKADLLQCQLKLAQAAAVYREALRISPGLSRAEASAKLCDELLAAPAGADGKLTRESLARLYVEMQKQQRPAAELMPVARLLGEEKRLLAEYWLARLKDLPVSAQRPLKERLTLREDGRLALDLSQTKVNDLAALAGAPLAALNLSQCSEVTDLSPLRGIDLVDLDVSETNVSDLTPLRDTQSMQTLELSRSKATDLSPLSGLRLKTIRLRGCGVSDLRPLRTMRLEEVNLRETRVSDLSPLVGMPVRTLELSFAPVQDFSPLAQLPLERLLMQSNRIQDLSVLRGLPLKELSLWGCWDARNYAALIEIKSLELLLLPSEYRDLPPQDYDAIGSLRKHPRLRQLGAEIMNQMSFSATGSTEQFWKDWDREQTFVPELRRRGVDFSLRKLSNGTYSLSVENQVLTDLSLLKDVPLSRLEITGYPITDLSPIRDQPLEALNITCEAADLSPLQGMPLKTLYLISSKVNDLSPLAGLPLQGLYLSGCASVTDLAVVGRITSLENLTVPIQAGNLEAVRNLPKLRRLGYAHDASGLPDCTAEEFWKERDWTRRVQESGFKPTMRRLDDGTWEVGFQEKNFSDLSILKGARISILWLQETSVVDLTALRGMPLRIFRVDGTNVADISPLQGMRLEVLYLENTRVADISVLRGMPLVELRLYSAENVTDLSPLAEAKDLRFLALPPNAKDFGFLRSLPKLERISFSHAGGDGRPDSTAAEFWKAYDAKRD